MQTRQHRCKELHLQQEVKWQVHVGSGREAWHGANGRSDLLVGAARAWPAKIEGVGSWAESNEPLPWKQEVQLGSSSMDPRSSRS